MIVASKRNISIQRNSFTFKSFGVKIGIEASHQEHLLEVLERLKKALPENFELFEKVESNNVEHQFLIEYLEESIYRLSKNGEIITEGKLELPFFNFLESKVRLTVAEYAESRVFLHAGVVSWKNKALVIPANSFNGKTTLVKELIKVGATYYSDEYAVLDENGFVHPFPKTLSVRETEGNYEQVEFSAEAFGGMVAKQPCPVGMVLITKFQKEAKWEPLKLKAGEGVLEMIPHCLPIRRKPKFTLQVLNKIATRAIICKSLRGDAEKFAFRILEFFELNT